MVDRVSLRAIFGGRGPDRTGPDPTDRAKAGTELLILTDARGVWLAAVVTVGNRHDVTELLALVDAHATIRGRHDWPVTKLIDVIGDRGYDSGRHRRALRRRDVDPSIAERVIGHHNGLGTLR